MSIPILVFGASGTGKSYAMRNFQRGEVAVVNVLGKPFPFGEPLETAVTRDITQIERAIMSDTAHPTIVVDDFGYTITDIYMRGTRGAEKKSNPYEIYTDIAGLVYDFINRINADGRTDRIIFLIMHDDTDAAGNIIPATIGKLLNEKINLLGMFALVMTSQTDGEHYWLNVHRAPAKTPPGMFDEPEQPNDYAQIVEHIREFYRLGME